MHEGVGIGQPVVTRPRQHQQFHQMFGDRRDRSLVEVGILLGVFADRQDVPGL
jgi:hypothetical protein